MTQAQITSRRKGAGISRRDAIKLAAGSAALATPLVLLPRKTRAATRIVATDVGGPYTAAYGEAYYKPFNEAMKGEIEVVSVTIGSNPTAECAQMVASKNFVWDLVDIGSLAEVTLRSQGLVEELHVDDDPDVKEIPADFRTPYMIGLDSYATILAYRTDAFRGKEPVNGWRDMWNVTEFPGRRALRKSPFDTIELALMADGVDTKNVYPCDFDRAYRSLAKLKPNVAAWWTTGAQTSQMLNTREVDMVPTWNGRAQAIIDAGGPVKISWNQGLLTWGGWVVLKGNPKLEACRKLIKFASNAKRQAVVAQHAAYGPCNPNAYKYIDEKRGRILSTFPEYRAQMTVIDDQFWGSRKEAATERFNSWLLS
jgi:putative spermidine/putrescine transport system substrate-binding protein